MRQNPDIVLVHYLNVPSLEDSGKCSPLLCAVADRHDSVRWSRDDLLSQLRPMCMHEHLTACVCLIVWMQSVCFVVLMCSFTAFQSTV